MILLAGLALADGALLGIEAAAGWPGPLATGGLHILLTLAALARAHGDDNPTAGWDSLAFPVGAIAGPIAILLLTRLRPWASLAPAVAKAPAEEPRTKGPGEPAIIARIADQRLRYPAPDRLQSLATILRHGDLASRCNALQTVVRSFEPRLSPLVAAALRDPDQTVRALAAATSAQVSANVASRVSAIVATPADDPRERFDAAILLVDHGTHNVLLSQAQRITLRSQARTLLQDLSGDRACPATLRAPIAAALFRLDGGRGRHRGQNGLAHQTPRGHA